HDHETGSHYLPLVVSLSAYNTRPQLNSPEIKDWEQQLSAAQAQPESEIPFGNTEPMEVTDDMVFEFHNSISIEPITDDEFRDIKHGLCAVFMNIPTTEDMVITPKNWKLVPSCLTPEMKLQMHTLCNADCPKCGKEFAVDVTNNIEQSWADILAAVPEPETHEC
ncbi:hypothetical protein, partial [Yersinia enterocolitica]